MSVAPSHTNDPEGNHDMTTTSKRTWGVVAAVLLGSVAAACGDDSSSSSDTTAAGGATTVAGSTTALTLPSTTAAPANQPKAGGKVTVIHVSNPSSLDPITGGSGNDHMSLYPMYDRLVNFDPATLQPQPGLATKWDFPDPLSMTLELRSGVKFHDGTDFDAAAVKFNLDRAKTLPKSTVKADISMIDSVEVVSPTQVKIKLTREDKSLLLIMADRPGMMSSPAAVQAAGDDYNRKPVGTGPYKFVEWLPNDRLVVAKNASYWQQGKPYLDQITIRYIPDAQTGINALKAGEADLAMKVPISEAKALQSDKNLTVSVAPSLGLETCYFNFSKPPFDKVEVRQAFQMAVNREALNESFTFGLATPAYQVYPPGYWAYQSDLAKPWKADAAGAKAMLAKAGFPDGVTIKAVAYDASGQTRKNEIIQAQIAEAGFKMTFDVMEVGAATSTFFEKLTYDLYCAGWSGRPDPSQTALSLFGSKAFYNAGKVAFPGMDEALSAAGKSADTKERAKAFNSVVKISQDQAIFTPLLHQPDVNAFNKKVGGFAPNLYGKIDVSFLWLNS
jgi:peptide/nickel transport system substrate-binding protein